MRRSPSHFIGIVLVTVLGHCCLPTARAEASHVRPRVREAVDVTKLVTLEGNVHPLARPEFDHGAAPDDLPLRRMLLVLKRGPEEEKALGRLLAEQQTQSSPEYHRWLTPEEFGQRFGPAEEDIQAVTAWLASQGFAVTEIARGHTVIEFSGTAGLVRRAFGTEIHKYVVHGEEHWANSRDPRIPAALAPVVAGFASLHNFRIKPLSHHLGTFSRSRATGEVRPLFTFKAGRNTFFAVGPSDFATIYNVLPLWNAGTDGTGRSIGIVADSNINIQDARDFRNIFGLPANDPNIILNGPDPGIISGEGEADLDVEWSGAVARGATIDLVVSETTETTDAVTLSALFIVENNHDDVLSVSFGACEQALGVGGNALFSGLWEQAAAQGITVLVATGDNGSAGCDFFAPASFGLAVSGLASTPFNVAVGGTDFNDVGRQATFWNTTNASPSEASAKSYIPESTWNDSCAAGGSLTGCTSVSPFGLDIVAASGGQSNCALSSTCGAAAGYPKPPFQTGTGVPSDGVRDVPDLSLFAAVDSTSASFYVFCQTDANASVGGNPSSCDLNSPFLDFQGAGGTSISAPAFAGIMAMVNQRTGSRQGNANFVLYPLAATSGASCASDTSAVSNSSCIFYDVVTGNVSVACAGGSPNCSNTSTASGQFGILVNPANPSEAAWTTTPGYDRATGLGSINAANLVNNWTSVSFKGTTTSLALAPTTLKHGDNVMVTIGVSSATGTPTGDVALVGGPTSSLGLTFFTLAGGTAGGMTNLLPGGKYNVAAHYPGDGTFGASDSAPVAVTVNAEGSQTFVSLVTIGPSGTNPNASSAAYGSMYVLRVDVTNSLGHPCPQFACPTGQVTVTDNGASPPDQSPPPSSVPGTFTLNSAGSLEDQFVQFPVGSHTLAAKYAGDNSFSGSTSSPNTITITTAPTTTTVFPHQSPAGSASLTLVAVVSTQSSGVAPTGTVQFLNSGTPIPGTVTLTPTAGSFTSTASLLATLDTSFTAMATVTAVYTSGDMNYSSSTSAPVTITISDFSLMPSTTSISISAGQSGTATIALTPVGTFSGMATFSCQVPISMREAGCSVSPNSVAGSGTTTLTVTTAGRHTFRGLAIPPGWMGPFLSAPPTVPLLVFLLILVLLAGWLRSGRAVPLCRTEAGDTRNRKAAGFGNNSRLRPASIQLARWKLAFGLLFLAAVAATFSACAAGGASFLVDDPGTAPGSYVVAVIATSGAITHVQLVTVVVQ